MVQFLEELAKSLHILFYQTCTEELRAYVSEKNPIFYGKAKEITVRDGSKALYDQYFMESALSNAKSLMKQMDEEDKKFQINLIKLSLSMQSATSHASGETLSAKAANITKLQVDDRILLEEAKEIYDEIMKHRIKASDQDFTWLARQFDLQTSYLICVAITSVVVM